MKRTQLFQTINRTDCEIIRRNVRAGRTSHSQAGAGTGRRMSAVKTEAASGTCRCRQCGEKIAPGELALHFGAEVTLKDVNGYWLSECWLHSESCTAVPAMRLAA